MNHATGLLALASLAFVPILNAQEPPKPDVEVLARGPVHEAYAEAIDQQPGPGPVVSKQPPAPIEELPPDQKPEGDNVQWLPGYWGWDEERKDFIWVSGFWRTPPPGRVWVPGSWRAIGDGWQWVGGLWAPANPPAAAPAEAAPQANLQYLPPPPASLDAGPAMPAPSPDSIYVPGSWVYRERYVWRPGYWIDYRPGWVWIPAHYRWTPVGYVFIEGYWDYPLASRGILFSPVYIPPTVYVGPRFVYTPTYVVREECMYGALFVRRGWGCYYFGDYFEARYASVGFTPWCGGQVTVGVTVGRGFYDPLFSYYRVAYRSDPFWGSGISTLYVGRFGGTIAPPPRTFVQQNVVVNNITINNTTVNKTNVVNNVNMVSSLSTVQAAYRLNPVAPEARRQFAKEATQFHEVAAARRNAETQLVARGISSPRDVVKPSAVRFELPKTAVARAQATAANPAVAPTTQPGRPAHAPTPPATASHPQGTPTAPHTLPAGPGRPQASPLVSPTHPPTVTPAVQPRGDHAPVPGHPVPTTAPKGDTHLAAPPLPRPSVAPPALPAQQNRIPTPSPAPRPVSEPKLNAPHAASPLPATASHVQQLNNAPHSAPPLPQVHTQPAITPAPRPSVPSPHPPAARPQTQPMHHPQPGTAAPVQPTRTAPPVAFNQQPALPPQQNRVPTPSPALRPVFDPRVNAPHAASPLPAAAPPVRPISNVASAAQPLPAHIRPAIAPAPRPNVPSPLPPVARPQTQPTHSAPPAAFNPQPAFRQPQPPAMAPAVRQPVLAPQTSAPHMQVSTPAPRPYAAAPPAALQPAHAAVPQPPAHAASIPHSPPARAEQRKPHAN